MEKIYAYIDESGNTNIDFNNVGASTHYILVAIIVTEKQISKLEKSVEEFRKKHFQTGEIKSSNIKANNDHRRRKRLLEELGKISFQYFAFVVDKSLIIQTSGLKYKKSFLKYLNDKLYYELNMAYPNLSIIADKHGSEEFMIEFSKYIIEKHSSTLIDLIEGTGFSFDFVDSRESVIVQLADLIAGTLSFGYEKSKFTNEFDDFYNYIKKKEIGKKEWPEKYEDLEHVLNSENVSEYDDIIAQTSIRVATEYILNCMQSTELEEKERLIVVEYLLRQLEFNNGEKYSSSYEMIQHLKNRLNFDRSHRYFRTKIIAKIRDSGVLIASSNKGYKIPLCKKDIYSFVSRTNSNIIPMFERLNKARQRIMLATRGEFDILGEKEYQRLKDFLDHE